MIEGNSVTLAPDQQQLVATWGVKTMMVYQLTHPNDRSVPDEHYSWLRDHGEPPPLSEVWIGRYSDATRYSYYWHRGLSSTFVSDELVEIPWRGFGVGLSVGALVYVWYGEVTRRPDRKRPIPSGQLARALLQICPVIEPASWPPGAALNDEDMNAFLEAFTHP
jgi:hypothetical protein